MLISILALIFASLRDISIFACCIVIICGILCIFTVCVECIASSKVSNNFCFNGSKVSTRW